MLTLRDATPEDASTLCEAERQLVSRFDGMLVSEPEELAESNFTERLAAIADGSGKYLLIENDGNILAHGCLCPMGLKKISHVLRLDMCVHVGHWRQGHGRQLLSSLVAWARTKSSAHKIELLVRAENEPAVLLYRKFGFIEEGRFKDRVRLRSGRFIDDIAMALLLKQ